jgi:hypothetical protein
MLYYKVFCALLLIILVTLSESKQKIKKQKIDVPKSIERAIHGMTASGLPHHIIQRNIQNHFPDKHSHEINDMIVISNAKKNKHAKNYKKNNSKGQRVKMV